MAQGAVPQVTVGVKRATRKRGRTPILLRWRVVFYLDCPSPALIINGWAGGNNINDGYVRGWTQG